MDEASKTSTEDKPQKRSQRVQLACLPCRQGKLKCNRDFPVCDQCYKRSREPACVYTERGLRYNAAKHNAQSMREKIDRLESFVNRLKDSKGISNEEDGETAKDKVPSYDDVVQQLAPVTGNLRLSNSGGTQYTGPANWESIIEDITDVKAYFESESSPGVSESDEGSFSPSAVMPVDITFGIIPGYTKQDIFQLMPSKPEMDRLVATWFQSLDFVRLLLHGPTFQQEYQQFWYNPDHTSCAWIALLLSVATLGAEVSGQSRQDSSTLARAEDLRRLTAHALVVSDHMAPQPFVIEALILHVKSLLLKNHDTTRTIWHIGGQIMRLCLQAGYHRDPGLNPAITPFQCEMRRRVWIFACEHDCMPAYQLGLVSSLNRSMCDTAPPANLLDTDFSVDYVPTARPDDEYTQTTAAIGYSKLVTVFGDITIASHRLAFPTKSETESLRTRLEDVRNKFPSQLKMIPLDQSFMDPPELILDRFHLHLLYLKALCVLYRPFLGRLDYPKEHQSCLDAAEDTVRHITPLVEAQQPGGQLEGCLVFVCRHVHDFNLSAMLLCSELKRLSTSSVGHEYKEKSMKWGPMILQAGSQWSLSRVTSSKARAAIRAMEKFLLQDPQLAGFRIPDVVGGAQSDNNQSLAAMSQTLPPNLPADIAISTSAGLQQGQEAFSIDQDPLFRDLFGATYSERFQSTWP